MNMRMLLLSLEALVRAKDLKGRDQPGAGQDHTDQRTCACCQAVHRASRGPRIAVSTAQVPGTLESYLQGRTAHECAPGTGGTQGAG